MPLPTLLWLENLNVKIKIIHNDNANKNHDNAK